MTFANTILQDGFSLVQRVVGPKLIFLFVAVALLIVTSAIYTGEGLRLSLKSGFVFVGILFIAQILILIVFVYKMLFCALLGSSEEAPLNRDFWRFVGFCATVGILLLIVQLVFMMALVLVAPMLGNIPVWAESRLFLVLLSVLYSFVLSLILFGLGTIFPAYMVGVNASFGDAFNRLKSQFSYLVSRVLLIMAIQIGLSLLQTGITALLTPVSAEDLSQVSWLIVEGGISLVTFCLYFYLLAVSLIVICRAFVRADFCPEGSVNEDLHETRLELPYLAGVDLEAHGRKHGTEQASWPTGSGFSAS